MAASDLCPPIIALKEDHGFGIKGEITGLSDFRDAFQQTTPAVVTIIFGAMAKLGSSG
jgi:hypothetical protein